MKNKNEKSYFAALEDHLAELLRRKKSPLDIIKNFPIYAPRQVLSRFFVMHELFKQVLNIKGSIVECGVFQGAGLMTWAQLSAIYEPVNYHREIIGFDTFSGFPDISHKDKSRRDNANARKGGIAADSYSELLQAIKLYDANRSISHMPKVKLIKGDFMKTGPAFLRENKHTLISLLYLDFDVYRPTKEALRLFLPRMSQGSILAFDEANNPDWPGETLALLEELDLHTHTLQQFYYEPDVSYIVL